MRVRVELMPEGADPMEFCATNVIQWIHRSTRGLVVWKRPSPTRRTGEIIKGPCLARVAARAPGLFDCGRFCWLLTKRGPARLIRK